MSGFLRALLPIHPTKKGLAFVKTEEFRQLCLHVTRDLLTARKSNEEIEGALRRITISKLMPARAYNEQERIDFYKRNFQLIDSAWFVCVQKLIEDYTVLERDPLQWLRERGLLPASAAGIGSHASLDKPLGTSNVPENWKEGEDFVAC